MDLALFPRDIRSVIARFVPLYGIVQLMCCSKTYRTHWTPLLERRILACARASLDARCNEGDLLLLFLAENYGVFCFQRFHASRCFNIADYYGRFWEREGTFHLTATQKITGTTVARFGKSEECVGVEGVALDLGGKVFLKWPVVIDRWSTVMELTLSVVSHGPFSFNYIEFFKHQLPKHRERRVGLGKGEDEGKKDAKK